MRQSVHLLRAAVWLVAISVVILANRDAMAAKIYWLDDIGIQRANLDGSGVETIVAGARTRPLSSFNAPLVLDSIHNRIYWRGSVVNELFSVNLDGSDRRSVLIPGFGLPLGFALDASAGTIYFANASNETVERVNLDGSGLQTIAEDHIPFAVAVDPAGGKVYWGNPHKGLRRANIDGTGREDLVDNNRVRGSIVLDTAAARIYWAAADIGVNLDGWIWTSAFDGSDARRLVMLPSLGLIQGLTLDADSQTLYWTDRFNGEIFAYDIPPLTGSGPDNRSVMGNRSVLDNPRRIVSGLDSPVGIIFVIPEPSGWLLCTLGGALLLLGHRRLRRGNRSEPATASFSTDPLSLPLLHFLV